MQQKHSPARVDIFREDNLYTFTLSQHAALAILLQHAFDRVGDGQDRDTPTENIILSTPFKKRYEKILLRANRIGNYAWASQATEDVDLFNVACEKLTEHLATIRNYFSHYIHTPNNILNLQQDTVFKAFLCSLEELSLDVWKKHHEAWENPSPLDSVEVQKRAQTVEQVHDFHWGRAQRDFSVYQTQQAPIPVHQLLLFISIFSTKGMMHRYLQALHIFKGDQAKTGTRKQSQECLTSLCLRNSHDTLSTQSPIIVAMTILDRFAHRLGRRIAKDGSTTQVPPSPAQQGKTPHIVQNFSPTFFLRMLAATIEAENIFPEMQIARSYKGKPSFALEHNTREVYIGQNSLAIRLNTQSSPIKGQLGIHALKVILGAWLNDKINKEEVYKLFTLLHESIQSVTPRTDPKVSFGLPQRLTQNGNINTDNLDATALRIALTSKVEQLSRTLFSSNIPKHRKATATLWWINRRLPQNMRLSERAYKDALFALSGNTVDKDLLQQSLPTIPQRQLAFSGNSTLHKVTNADSLDTIFRRICGDFKHHFRCLEEIEPLPLDTLQTLGKLIRLRCACHSPLDQEKSWKDFSQRFSFFISPPAYEVWKALKLPGFGIWHNKRGHQGRIPLGKLLKNVTITEQALPQNLYAYLHEGKLRFSTKTLDCYNCDKLLYGIAQKLARHSRGKHMTISIKDDLLYTATQCVTVGGTVYTIAIDAAQARRSYVSLHEKRIKNIITAYWKPYTTETCIPFVCATPSTKKNDTPRSWLEAEVLMEKERRFMIEVILQWEKELAHSCAAQAGVSADMTSLLHLYQEGTYVTLDKILTGTNFSHEIGLCKKYRNWALHRAPEHAFNTASGELGQRFQNHVARIKEKSKRQTKEAHKRR